MFEHAVRAAQVARELRVSAKPAYQNGPGNFAPSTVDELAAVMKSQLKNIQHRPAVIGGFPRQTGLTLDRGPP
jgi:hypothetical protein